MVKLRTLNLHKLEDVPDHVIETMKDFTLKLSKHTMPVIDSVDPNVALAGINWFLPIVIKRIVTNNPEELRKAVFYSCKMLMKNMDVLIEEIEKEKLSDK